jgi:hypothetical protein
MAVQIKIIQPKISKKKAVQKEKKQTNMHLVAETVQMKKKKTLADFGFVQMMFDFYTSPLE